MQIAKTDIKQRRILEIVMYLLKSLNAQLNISHEGSFRLR